MEDLRALAVTGADIAVRVSPRARRSAVEADGPVLRVRVTAAPEGGRANAEAAKVLARALGVPPSRLSLVRGASARDKVFRILPP